MSTCRATSGRGRAERMCGLLVALAVTAGTYASAGSAAAAQGGRKVTGADFPTAKQVARTLPYLAGGSRDLYPDWRSPPEVASAECVYYVSSTVKVRSSRLALYLTQEGESAYWSGKAAPVVTVWRYRKPRLANAALAELRESVKACWGTTKEPGGGGYSVTYRKLKVPSLGRDRMGFRQVRQDPNTGRDWFAEVWVVSGRNLINARLQHDTKPPAAAPLIALARKSVRAASS